MMQNAPLSIRLAQPEDIAAPTTLAVETYVAAFGHSFTAGDLATHLGKNLSPERIAQMITEDVVLLAEVEGRLIGYVQFGDLKAPGGVADDQELRRLYVHPAFQNRRYGGALMEVALAHPRMAQASHIFLDVWEHNHSAQRFYRRFGFEVIGRRTFEVESGEPDGEELIMVRPYAAVEAIAFYERLEYEPLSTKVTKRIA